MKKVSKKVLALLCAMVMMIGCVTGCGSTETSNKMEADASEEVTDNADMEDTSNEEDVAADEDDSEDSEEADFIDVSTFTLDGKEYSLPMSYEDMEKISPLADLSEDVMTVRRLYDSWLYYDANGNEKSYQLENGLGVQFFYNPYVDGTADQEPVTKCQVIGLKETADSNCKIECNGITIGSTLDDVLKAFPFSLTYVNMAADADSTLSLGMSFSEAYKNDVLGYCQGDAIEDSYNLAEDGYTETSYNEEVLHNTDLLYITYGNNRPNENDGKSYNVSFTLEKGKVVQIEVTYYDNSLFE